MSAALVSDALVAALRGAGALAWVSAPEGTRPPYTIIGQIVSDPLEAKGSKAEWHTVEILDWCVAPSRDPVSQRMKGTKDALDGVEISFPGLAPFRPAVLPGAVDELHEDGVTWSGSQKFRILGQPAA